MQCPRCQAETQEMSNHKVVLDVCYKGCGGIWFDPHELKKMDEQHESDESFLAELSQSKTKEINVEHKINCPKCESQPMFRRYRSVKKEVEIDECPQCAGVWLDAAELTHIYRLYKTDTERQKAANELFEDMFGDKLIKMKAESLKDLESARRLAHALRFICPSYYIPGKQDWGNF